MCAGACVWARIGAVVYGVSQEDIAAYGRKRGTEEYKWRASLIPCRLVFEKGNHAIPVIGGFLRGECKRLFEPMAGIAPLTINGLQPGQSYPVLWQMLGVGEAKQMKQEASCVQRQAR